MRQPDLSALRAVGSRHGIIKPHRGLRQLTSDPRQVLESIVLICAGTAAWVFAMPAVGHLWLWMVGTAVQVLRIEGSVAAGTPMIPHFAGGLMPALQMPWSRPSIAAMAVTAVVSIVALVATFKIPSRFLPLAYWIRALAAVELSAVAFFALSGADAVANVADATLAAGVVMIGMVPTLFGLTLYMFDPSLRRGALIMACTMGHLVVLLPLQYLLQLSLLQASSQLLAPACFLALGPALDVMIIVAFYGWAMGRDPRRKRAHPSGIV